MAGLVRALARRVHGATTRSASHAARDNRIACHALQHTRLVHLVADVRVQLVQGTQREGIRTGRQVVQPLAALEIGKELRGCLLRQRHRLRMRRELQRLDRRQCVLWRMKDGMHESFDVLQLGRRVRRSDLRELVRLGIHNKEIRLSAHLVVTRPHVPAERGETRVNRIEIRIKGLVHAHMCREPPVRRVRIRSLRHAPLKQALHERLAQRRTIHPRPRQGTRGARSTRTSFGRRRNVGRGLLRWRRRAWLAATMKGDDSSKITHKIARAKREGRVWWSFEYFPPRTPQGMQNLYDRIERMSQLGPEFVDITWNAGGRTSDMTTQLVKTVHAYFGVETCMHLTCTNMPRSKIEVALREAKEFGCRNVLALRGDPPACGSPWEPHAAGFSHAYELVQYIREHYGDYFTIAVAGFPEGHPEATGGPDVEMQHLKQKIDAGADFIFTQMFYDLDAFVGWSRRVRATGITVPIVPGVMPIQNYGQFTRAVARFQAFVPPHFHEALDPVKDDDEQVRVVGTRLVGDMCRQMLAHPDLDVHGLHIYTMNLERGSRMLLEYLGLTPSVNQLNPLPWRPSLTPKRRDENIRPIFWANRAKSYVNRTDGWDEYPNGRWGDARSPAFGDLGTMEPNLPVTQDEARALWGTPTSVEDLQRLFVRFCAGELASLPWSDAPIAKETKTIDQLLVQLNERGFLTINSQPAVDGAPSTDPVHGWGPPHGYVYQKAYLEFFVSTHKLDELIARIEAHPQITYHAVNAQGDMRTNTTSDAPNAVTWGCFPHCEILQPTIVESMSFLAWKDEAFQIGRCWAAQYEPDSPTRRLLEHVFDTYFLVNVVHNDFKRPHAIFEPFLTA